MTSSCDRLDLQDALRCFCFAAELSSNDPKIGSTVLSFDGSGGTRGEGGRKDTRRQLEQRRAILGIAMAGGGTPLQGGSGWSISGALYVTNLRTRRSLMPVRGPRVCARARARVGY